MSDVAWALTLEREGGRGGCGNEEDAFFSVDTDTNES